MTITIDGERWINFYLNYYMLCPLGFPYFCRPPTIRFFAAALVCTSERQYSYGEVNDT